MKEVHHFDVHALPRREAHLQAPSAMEAKMRDDRVMGITPSASTITVRNRRDDSAEYCLQQATYDREHKVQAAFAACFPVPARLCVDGGDLADDARRPCDSSVAAPSRR